MKECKQLQQLTPQHVRLRNSVEQCQNMPRLWHQLTAHDTFCAFSPLLYRPLHAHPSVVPRPEMKTLFYDGADRRRGRSRTDVGLVKNETPCEQRMKQRYMAPSRRCYSMGNGGHGTAGKRIEFVVYSGESLNVAFFEEFIDFACLLHLYLHQSWACLSQAHITRFNVKVTQNSVHAAGLVLLLTNTALSHQTSVDPSI